jgi:hypothetical protein
MIDFGKPIAEVESKGSSERPEAKGYVGVITAVEATESKAGNPMVIFHTDIAEGDSAGYFKGDLRLYQTYHEDTGKGILKSILESAKKENPKAFSKDNVTATGFDEQALVNARIGLVLGYNEEGYLNVRYLTTVDRALKAKALEAPTKKGADSNAPAVDEDLPF